MFTSATIAVKNSITKSMMLSCGLIKINMDIDAPVGEDTW